MKKASLISPISFKAFFLIPLISLFTFTNAFGTLENFETETTGATTFSQGGTNFSTSGSLDIGFFLNGGSNGSGDSRFLEALNASGNVGTVSITNPGMAFQINSIDVWLSTITTGDQSQSGTLTLRGNVFGGGTIDAVIPINPPNSNSWTFVDLTSTTLNGVNLTGFQVILSSGINYAAIDDFDFTALDPNAVNVSINDVSMVEGSSGGTTAYQFTITRSNNNTTFNVTAATSNGSALSGTDYTAVSPTTVNFVMGQSLTQTLTVNVGADFDPESDENFFVNLSNPTNGAILVDNQGVGNILDDDTICEDFEDEAMAGLMAFSQGGISFSTTNQLKTGFFSPGGGGSSGSDYYLESDINNVPHSGTVGTIQITTPNKVFEVLELDLYLSTDNDPDTAEPGTVTFTGTLASGGTVTATQSTTGSNWENNLSFNGTSFDGALLTSMSITLPSGGQYVAIDGFKFAAFDNNAVLVSINDVCQDEGDSGQSNFTFTISRNNTTTAFDVTVQSAPGTATPGSDYTSFGPVTLSFAVGGAISQTVNVVVFGDPTSEIPETFQMNLSNATNGAVIASGLGTGIIKDDDTACETFEDEAMAGLTTFSQDGISFSVNDELVTGFFGTGGGGSGGSDYYLETDITNVPFPSGSVGTISVTTPGMGIRLLRSDIWLSSDNDPDTAEPSSVQFVGTLVGGGTATVNINTTNSSNWTQNILFAGTALDNQVITAIEVILTGQSNYFALDNLCFEPVVLGPEIAVTDSGGDDIVSGGSNSPSVTNDTDFLLLCSPNTNTSRTYTISNTGSQDLLLTGSPLVDLSGTGASHFSVSSSPSSTILPSNSTSFTIMYAPTSAGVHNALVTIPNNDNDENPFTFNIRGTADNTNPTITCPSNITVANDNGLCGANVTYNVTTSDNCPVPVLSCSPASGSFFAIGTTTVSCTLTDQWGNTASCSFTVIVNDTENPTITCPANISVGTDPGMCSAVVTYSAPSGNDNCPGSTTALMAGIGSGGTFPAGVNTETYTVTDASGNTASCSFNVTVNDSEDPTITCPSDITVGNDPGQCGATVSFNITASDNCDTPMVTGNPASGSFFPLGTTTVSATIIDTQISCSFTVTVNDTEDPTITCPADITVDNDPGQCGATVSFSPTSNDNCPGVTAMCSPMGGSFFTVGTTSVTCTATDAAGNTATCNFNVTVNDTEDPTITCPADITVDNDPGQCGATVSFSPTSNDNCPGVTAMCSPMGESFFTVGTTPVTCTATDAAGNSATCNFNVTVNDTEDPTITCPADITVDNDPGQCGAAVSFSPTSNDNCPGVMAMCSPMGESFFNIGTTPVTCTATDAAGNSASCNFNVTVNDTEDPTVACPADITVNSDPGQCGASVSFSPTQNDNCPGVTAMCLPMGGSFFNIGTTPVTCTATDAAGNTATCNFSVTVNDNEMPTIACPGGITVDNDPGQCNAVVTYTPPIGNDNCPGSITALTVGIGSGGTFPVGANTETYTVTDASGNTASCSFTVTVNDNEAPILTCPPAVTVECGDDTSQVGTGSPTITENCGFTALSISDSFASACGSTGTITRTFTGTDASGNSSSCDQVITIEDNVAPLILCTGTGPPPQPIPLTETEPNNTPLPPLGSGVQVITQPAQLLGTVGPVATDLSDFWNIANGLSGDITVFHTQSFGLPVIASVQCYADAARSVLLSTTAVSPFDPPLTVTLDGSLFYSIRAILPLAPSQYDITITGDAFSTGFPVMECPAGFNTDPVGQNTPQDSSIDPSITGMPIVFDICDPPTVTYQDVVSVPDPSNCPVLLTVTRTWTATDACGNSDTCEQIFEFQDTTPPTITCPANTTIECGDSTNPLETGEATATDTCSDVSVSSSDSFTSACGSTGVIIRLWTATDACGNSSTCEQLITIEDTTPPDAQCQDITVSLSNGSASITADQLDGGSSDICDMVQFSASQTSFGCSDVGTVSVVLTVTDACANSSTCSSTVTVVNGDPLTITGVVSDQLGPIVADGAIDITVTGTTGPYQYAWSNGATTEDISNLVGLMTYSVVVTDANGCETSASFFVDQGVLVPMDYCLDVYLQGFFDPLILAPLPPMRTTLNDLDLLPLAQPFNDPAFGYSGPEAFPSQPLIPPQVTDWVLLRFRGSADPSVIAGEMAAVVLNDGSITDVDGGLPRMFLDPADSYFIEILHPNHLPVSTPLPQPVNPLGGTLCWDFTFDMAQAFDDPAQNDDPMAIMLSVNGTFFGMVGGNVQNLDCQVEANDINLLFTNYLMTGVYITSDTNRDGQVDVNDINLLFFNYNRNGHKPY